jgi:hypothetical protein
MCPDQKTGIARFDEVRLMYQPSLAVLQYTEPHRSSPIMTMQRRRTKCSRYCDTDRSDENSATVRLKLDYKLCIRALAPGNIAARGTALQTQPGIHRRHCSALTLIGQR